MPEAIAFLHPSVVEQAVRASLEEDGAFDDVTTRAVIRRDQWGRGTLVARETGVIAGLPLAGAAFLALDAELAFDALAAEGASVEAGAEIAQVEGAVAGILSAERVALNFLQRLSGIATLTRAFVDEVAGTKARILDTRKTTPGLRRLERYAVRAGGGQNHRFGLSDGVLIKDNHIAASRESAIDDMRSLVARARAAAPHTMRVEVEVTSVDDADEAAGAGADVILLDNMSADDCRRALERIAGRALVEASGGVTLENVRAVAEAGVDFISVGRLTHSAPALDVSLELTSL